MIDIKMKLTKDKWPWCANPIEHNKNNDIKNDYKNVDIDSLLMALVCMTYQILSI